MQKTQLNLNCGERLKQCLKEANLTQAELALTSGYTQQYISNIIVGKKPVTVKAASLFAKVLNVRQEFLLCEDDYKTEDELWSKRRKLFDTKENIALHLLHLAGYEPICDFIKNWKELGLDKKIYGPFKKGDTAAKHIPLYLDNGIEWATEILTPNGKHFYCDGIDFQLLSYELIEYINFRMAQLESKYAWQYDDGGITPKSPGSEYNFYPKVNAQENPNFLENSIWVTHEDNFFPQMSPPKDE